MLRALFVDRPLRFPLDRAADPSLQRRTIMSALEMLSVDVPGPLLRSFADASVDAA